jgi:hypothetical protein
MASRYLPNGFVTATTRGLAVAERPRRSSSTHEAADRGTLMRDDASSRLESLASRALYVYGAILFFAVFSLDREHAGSGLTRILLDNPKFFYRCIPLLLGFPIVLAIDGLFCQLQGMKSLCSIPGAAIVWFLGVSVGAAYVFHQPLLGGWKAYEYLFMAYWASVATSFSRQRGSTTPVQLFFQCAGFMVCYIWLFAAFSPKQSFVHWGSTFLPMLTCPYPHIVQNHIGFLTLTVFIIAVASDLFDGTARPLRWVLIGASLAAVVLSHTRTAYLALGVFCGLVVFTCIFSRSNRIPNGKRLFYFSAASLSLLLVTSLFAINSDAVIRTITRGQNAEQIQELSGRSTIWKIAFREFKKNPYTGYGLSIGSRRLNKIREYNRALADKNKKWSDGTLNIHSSVLESLLSAGLLGAIPLLVVLFIWMPATVIRHAQPLTATSLMAVPLCLTLLIRAVFVSNLALYSLDSMLFASLIFSYAHKTPPILASTEHR